MKQIILLTSLGAVACITYIVASNFWEEPEVVQAEETVDDTGMSRDQTEDLMRTIGYVQ